MLIIRDLQGIKQYIKDQKKKIHSIGFVPTMGALHEGHLSLCRQSLLENQCTIGSIFVNPIQFNNPKDLEQYPRTEDSDLNLLKSTGCNAVFIPSVKEIYPEPAVIKFNFGHLETVMEGKHRPGHFSGVAVVVSKFFNIIEPDKAYFGSKDFQQVAIIKQLVKDLNFPVNIVECPTIREEDGLAMSSRNLRLSSEKRKLAPHIYEALKFGSTSLKMNDVAGTKEKIEQYLQKIPEISLEYFEIADAETLLPVVDVKDHKKIVLCIAAYLDGVRLIDNMLLFY
ncbi:MAG: pantoate--beta-alanine ligase [Cytophagaceae bacterium]